jgi:ERCC4-type nuclease
MLVAPTEPAQLRALGRVSSTPELYGADFLFAGKMGVVGVQRKEVSDLFASVDDDRLAKESAQMQALSIGVLLIEGKMQWTNDGQLVSKYQSRWTKTMLRGLLWSWQSKNLWVSYADSISDTQDWLSTFGRWIAKDRHSSLTGRKGPTSQWGKADSRDWALHFLQGIPGVGPVQAAAIYDHFGGIPMTMDVDRRELEAVKGIGKKRAAVITGMFNGIERLPDDT